MTNEFWYRLLMCVGVLIITDVLLYFGLKRIFKKSGLQQKKSRKFNWIFLSLSVLFLIYAAAYFFWLRQYGQGAAAYRQYFLITGVFILIYIPKLIMLVFVLFEAILIFLIQFISFITQHRAHYDFVRKVRRLKFFTWLGFLLGMATFGYIIYGMICTRTDYKLAQLNLTFKNLPPAFNGTKVLLISDAHLGSFYSEEDLNEAFDMIEQAKPDLIVFTGDMVNVSADEITAYTDKFKALKPPLGMYAVLGNHDQDDYMQMVAGPGREVMEAQVMAAEESAGFKVLRNDHVFIHRDNDSIALLGVDSWGLKPFKCYGKLSDAIDSVDNRTFKILLSHIPSHWVVEVKGKTNIDLTLAGHTHAAQMGIEFGSWHWSPIVWKYPYYMGLYQWGSQYLYVNPGLGYLGFPGRIGIRPEITVITLNRTAMNAGDAASTTNITSANQQP